MTQKKILPIVIAALIVVGVVLIGKSVPVYPAFQKEAGTFDKLKAQMSENAVFPELDGDTETEYTIILDRRTISAKPIGYVIESEKTSKAGEFRFSYEGKEEENQDQKHYESEYEYRNVNIGIAYGKDAAVPARSCCVTIQFSYRGMTYELKGLYTRNMDIEKSNDEQAADNQEKLEQMQDYLLKQCHEMIDKALEK